MRYCRSSTGSLPGKRRRPRHENLCHCDLAAARLLDNGQHTRLAANRRPLPATLHRKQLRATPNKNGSPVGQDITLAASDGFKPGAYRADPTGAPKAAIVVIQEIFGVNHHIRSVCDRLASAGYVAIAPAIFDRSQPNFQCGYSPDEVANARKFIA